MRSSFTRAKRVAHGWSRVSLAAKHLWYSFFGALAYSSYRPAAIGDRRKVRDCIPDGYEILKPGSVRWARKENGTGDSSRDEKNAASLLGNTEFFRSQNLHPDRYTRALPFLAQFRCTMAPPEIEVIPVTFSITSQCGLQTLYDSQVLSKQTRSGIVLAALMVVDRIALTRRTPDEHVHFTAL